MTPNVYRSILPHFETLTSPGPIKEPPGGQMLGARAATFMLSPGIAAMTGMGQMEPDPAAPAAEPERELPVWLGLLIIGGMGFLSYQIGSAMTPPGSKRQTWGTLGVPVGLLTGPLGLGVMAIVSNQRRS